jgi:hypothetical protein
VRSPCYLRIDEPEFILFVPQNDHAQRDANLCGGATGLPSSA